MIANGSEIIRNHPNSPKKRTNPIATRVLFLIVKILKSQGLLNLIGLLT